MSDELGKTQSAGTVLPAGGDERAREAPSGPQPNIWRSRHILEIADQLRTPSVLDAYNQGPLTLGFQHLAPSLRDGAIVLDLGCGTGHLTQALATAGLSACGIDIDRQNVSAARARRDQRPAGYVCGDIGALPFGDGSFDAVVSISVLQYVNWRRVIRECHRVLKPRGRALFLENLSGSPFAKAYRIVRRFAWRYPQYLKPIEHLRWDRTGEFAEVFSRVESRCHHLLAPALLLPHAFRDRRSAAFSNAGQLFFQSLQAIDNRLLVRWPTLARSAWTITVMCIKS